MKKYTVAQEKTLQDLKDYYEYCSQSDVRKKWLTIYNRNFNYYHGKQWEDKELLESLELIGCDTKTFNHVKPACNDVISILIRAGKRIGYLPTTDLQSHERLASYLKSWAFNIQTQVNHSYFSSLKVLSSLLSGIGWSQFGYDNGQFFYDYVDAREIFWDPDDQTARMEDSNVICRSYFVHYTTLKNKYPEEAKYFDSLVDTNKTHPDDANIADYDVENQTWVRGKGIRVVEVYYKKDDNYYETIASMDSNEDEVQEEHVLQTFFEDIAKRYSINGKIETKRGSKIFKGVFCKDLLLAHGEISEQIPNQKHFPLIPMVYQRDIEGMPIGIVNDIISPQDMINYIMSTIIHYTDSKTLICTQPTSDKVSIAETWAVESRKKSGSILLPDNKDLQILDNKQNVEHRLKVLQEVRNEIQSIMRIYDDFAGKQTNRISGVAIANSTINNLNAQNFLVLSYEHMISSEGKLMLDTLKGLKNINQVVIYYKYGKSTSATIDDSISMINFEVYPDTAPNFSSSIEEEKARFAEIMNSPSRDLIMSSALFLQEAGITDTASYKLSEEYDKVIQKQMQLQQGIMPQPEDEQEMTNEEVN